MNSIDNETPDILLKNHYEDLIEKLVQDTGQIELIQSLTKKYSGENSSFLDKLKYRASLHAIKENAHSRTMTIITNDESAILNEITSIAFQENLSQFEIQKAQVKVSKIEADNNFTLQYTKLYLDILTCIVLDKDKIEEEILVADATKTKGKELLDASEKLLLLQILIDQKYLSSISECNIHKITFPLLLGGEQSSMEKRLSEKKTKYDPKFYSQISKAQSRYDSLKKIHDLLKEKGLSDKSILSELTSRMTLFLDKIEQLSNKISKGK